MTRRELAEGSGIEQAVILAGGLGTRLRAVVSDRPKALADVGGRPFIGYILDQLRDEGILDVILCVGYGASQLQDALGDRAGVGLRIQYSVESELLGTGGALGLARPLLGQQPFLVMNGDSFFEVPLASLAAFHRDRPAKISLALARVSDGSRYGNVRVDAEGAIVEFAEKPDGGESALINGGVYVVDPAVLSQIPAARPYSLERELFPTMVGNGLFGREFPGYFIDIGTVGDYQRVRAEHLAGAGSRGR